MIIGTGDIASVLLPVDREDLLFFASGVSNSQETEEKEYLRELELLMEVSALDEGQKRLVYFSSLSIFHNQSRYTRHKRTMESAVKAAFTKHTIVRIGNITWGTNPHTLINFIRDKQQNGEAFEVRDEYRYIVEKDEFLHWLGLIPNFNCEMNITGRRMKVEEIVKEYGYTATSN